MNGVESLISSADPERGRDVFFEPRRANCASCHRVNGRGAERAPDLSGIGARVTPQQLLESILKPNAQIVPGYKETAIITDGGRLLSGVVSSETDTTVELLAADGRTIEVVKEDISERKQLDQSLMPSNYAELLAEQELADLASWLLAQDSRRLLDQRDEDRGQ